MFERKIMFSDRQRRRPALPNDVRLSLDEVDRYVVAAARARGYPEDFLTDAARQVPVSYTHLTLPTKRIV